MTQSPWRAQFSLADLLLVIAVVATWTAAVVSRQRLHPLRQQIAAMQRIAGELIISDPTQIHAIGQTVLRYPDESWQVHLPDGGSFRLCLDTREIAHRGFPPPDTVQTVAIDPGLHRIYLRREQSESGPRFVVLVDDVQVLVAQESKDWNTSGSSSATGIGKQQEVQPPSEPLQLTRTRVHRKNPDGGSSSPPADQSVNGLLLWITSVAPPH